MVQIALRAALVGCACLLAGCSLFRLPAAPDDKLTARQPVAGVDRAGAPMLSPDGKKLLWHIVAEDGIATLVRDVDSGATEVLRIGRNFPHWAYDSRRLIVEQDVGAAGIQILVLDTAQPKAIPLNLTPWSGVRSFVIHIGNERVDRIIFISNRRDNAAYDVYSADIRTGKVELLLQNSGDVVQWVMDEDGTVGARVRRQDEFYILQVLSKASRSWKSVYKWRQTEAVLPVRIERDAGKAMLVTKAGREKAEMIELKLAGVGAQKP